MTEPAARLSLTYTSPPSADPTRSETNSAIAAIAFLEGVSQLGTFTSLRAWFAGDIIPNRWAPGWESVREPGFRPISLSGKPNATELRKMLRVAHDNVVDGLRGLVWLPRDDAWLTALLRQGYLRFDSEDLPDGEHPRWTACVPEGRSLSELVLALLAADILARREIYAKRLCVCTACGRVTFEPETNGRLGCPTHPSRPTRTAASRRAITQ